MDLVCDRCGAEYRIDEAKVPKKGGFITCKSCSNKIRVPSAEEAQAARSVEPAPTTPVEPPPLDLPSAELPPLDAPGNEPPPLVVPAADLPPLDALGNEPPPLDVPAAELPPLDAPGNEPPPLDVPAADLPPLDAPGIEPPPLDVPGTELPPLDAPGIEPPPLDMSQADLPLESHSGVPPLDDVPLLDDHDAFDIAEPDDLVGIEDNMPSQDMAASSSDLPIGVDVATNPGASSELSDPLDLPGALSEAPESADDLPASLADRGALGSDASIDSADLGEFGADDFPDLPPLDDGSSSLPDDGLASLPDAAGSPPLDDLPMPSAPADLPMMELDDFAAPELDAQLSGVGGLQETDDTDFFHDANLASAVDDDSADVDPFLSDPLVGSDSDGRPSTSAAGSAAGEASSLTSESQGGAASAGSRDTSTNEEVDGSRRPFVRRVLPYVGAIAALALTVAGVGMFYPQVLGLKPATVPSRPEANRVKADPASPPEKPKPKPNAPNPSKSAEPEVPDLPPAPKLTTSNVHALPYRHLKTSVDAYRQTDDAEIGLSVFGLFRLAHIFGDDDAASQLQELAEAKPNPASAADELLFAGSLGAMVANGKASRAKKLGERALKSSLNESALVEYVTGLAYRGKPPAKALKHLNRAIELDPGLVDASIARAEILFRRRGAEQEAEASLRAAVAEVPGPAIALRAADILVQNNRFSALSDITKPLISSAQAEQLAPSDRPAFFRLLLAKQVWRGNLSAATAAARKWAELSDTTEVTISLARLAAANGADPEQILRDRLERASNDGERARILYALGRFSLQTSPAQTVGEQAITKISSILAESKKLSGKVATGWSKLLEGDLWVAKKKPSQAKAAYAASGRGRPAFVEPKLASLVAEGKKINISKLTQLEKRTNSAEVTFALADALRETGNAREAAALYEKGLWSTAAPFDPLKKVFAWARATADSGKVEHAYRTLVEIQKSRPEDAALVSELVRLAQEMGNTQEAVTWYKQLTKSVPDNVDHQINYARALNDAAQFDQAAAILDKLHRDKPDAQNGRSLAELGRAIMERDPVKARSLLNEAKDLAPSARVYRLYAQVEAKQGRYDEAIRSLQDALSLSGGDDGIRFELAKLQNERGRRDEAAANLRRVLRSTPDNLQALILLGDILLASQERREALQTFQKAIRIEPKNVELLMKTAELQIEFDELSPAVRGLRRVLELEPNNSRAYFHLGYAFKTLGRLADARSSLKRFLELDPESDEALQVQEELKSL